MSSVPPLRIRRANDQEVHASGAYVLYWMVASRRTTWNFSLQRAVEWARDLRKPLLVLEPLRCGYRWASDRLHAFVIQGMVDTAQALRQTNVQYYPYLEPEPGAGKELLPALAKNACVVISDDYPCFFLPRMFSAAAERLQVRFELVDSNGLLPMRAADRVFGRAVDFRRFLQKNLRPHLADLPEHDPLEGVRLPKLKTLPTEATRRWPPAEPRRLAECLDSLGQFPIDHTVGVCPTRGGSSAARETLRSFLETRLPQYESSRNEPEQHATSGLAPYLHFGHLAPHQVFAEVMAREDWSPAKLAEKATGSARDWWGVSAEAEAFLDQLITWRTGFQSVLAARRL